LIRRLLALGSSLLLAAVLLELSLRVWQPDGAEKIPAFVADRVTGWSREPDQHGFVLQRVPGSFRTRFQTNRLGLRDREYAIAKGDEPRVLSLGDSVTEGWGVEESETYPKILESRYLKDVEVWNLGVVGYGTDQELRQLERMIAELRPDIVTVAFFFNDLVENTLESARWAPNYVKPHFVVRGDGVTLTNADALEEQMGRADAASHRWTARGRALLDRLALYRFTRFAVRSARDRWRRAGPKPPGPLRDRSPEWWSMDNLFRIDQPAELDRAWLLTDALLAEMHRVCQRHGAKLVLVHVPCPIDGVPGMLETYFERMRISAPRTAFDTTIMERRLDAIARRLGVPLVEPAATFRNSRRPADLFLPDLPADPHIGKRGHELVARAVADVLARERMLPQRSFSPSDGIDHSGGT